MEYTIKLHSEVIEKLRSTFGIYPKISSYSLFLDVYGYKSDKYKGLIKLDNYFFKRLSRCIDKMKTSRQDLGELTYDKLREEIVSIYHNLNSLNLREEELKEVYDYISSRDKEVIKDLVEKFDREVNKLYDYYLKLYDSLTVSMSEFKLDIESDNIALKALADNEYIIQMGK